MLRPGFRQTLRSPVETTGVGVHSGARTRLRLVPAPPGTGRVFVRTDLGKDAAVPAQLAFVGSTDRAVRLERGPVSVSTVEHLLAALSALGVDDVWLELDGPEVPILDGSAVDFVSLIDASGLCASSVVRRLDRVVDTVRVSWNGSMAELGPASGGGLSYAVEVDFPHPAVGSQQVFGTLTPENFRAKLAAARTFAFEEELMALKARGLIRGAVPGVGVLFGARAPAVPLRFADEPVRHKALDLIGDLALWPRPLLGTVRVHRGGHRLHVALLRALFAQAGVIEVAEA